MGNDSKQQFIAQVNQDNLNLVLTKDDVVFGTVSDNPEGRSITRIVAVPGSGYRGGVTLRYNRLRLGKLFGFFQPKVLVPDDTEPTPGLLIALVKDRYGVELSEEDLTILRKTTSQGDFYVVEARDTSLKYSESTEIMLEFNQLEIGTVIDSETNNYVYPIEQGDGIPRLIDGLVYSGGWFVPEAGIELTAFTMGMSGDANLAWLAQTLSGDDWTHSLEPRERNTEGSLVDYNGPISGVALIEDPAISLLSTPSGEVSNVLVLKLDPTLCTSVTGSLTFYY